MKYNETLIKFLKSNDLCHGLSDYQIKLLALHMREIEIAEHEYIIRENDEADNIYLVESGNVEISRFDEETGQKIVLTRIEAGNVIGEIALIDNALRSASVRAITPVKLLAISINELRTLVGRENIFARMLSFGDKSSKSTTSIYTIMIQNIAKNLTRHIRSSNDAIVAALKNELENLKAQAAMSHLIINILVLLSSYIILLETIASYKAEFVSTTFISIPLLIFLTVPLLIMMKKSGYPFSVYGLTLTNWRKSIFESAVVTVFMMMCIIIYKWIMIHTDPSFSSRHLIEPSFSLMPDIKNKHVSFWYGAFLISLYMLFVPVQELITRGAIQSSFQILLIGRYKILWAIILSNLLFSVLHLHVSLGFGMVVLIPGLLWGWLYSRHGTLIGVTLSHLIVGAWAIFIVGVI